MMILPAPARNQRPAHGADRHGRLGQPRLQGLSRGRAGDGRARQVGRRDPRRERRLLDAARAVYTPDPDERVTPAWDPDRSGSEPRAEVVHYPAAVPPRGWIRAAKALRGLDSARYGWSGWQPPWCEISSLKRRAGANSSLCRAITAVSRIATPPRLLVQRSRSRSGTAAWVILASKPGSFLASVEAESTGSSYCAPSLPQREANSVSTA